MSKISNAILNSLLEEITDYELVKLSAHHTKKLQAICDRWEDKESIETEINRYLKSLNYVYTDDCLWVKGQKITMTVTETFEKQVVFDYYVDARLKEDELLNFLTIDEGLDAEVEKEMKKVKLESKNTTYHYSDNDGFGGHL